MGVRTRVANWIVRFADRSGEAVAGETATIISKAFGKWAMSPYVPDDLVSAKGGGLALYRGMLRDGHVKAAVLGKSLAVAGRAWTVTPASDGPQDVEIAEFITWAIRAARGLFKDDVRKILNALITGVSISEIVYRAPTRRGRFGDKIGLEAVKDKDPDAFQFVTDPFGNLTGLLHRPGTSSRTVPLDPEKFLIFSHLPVYGNPWGTSDLRAAYRAFWIKDNCWKFRAIFLERWGLPTPIGKYPRGQSGAREKMIAIIDSWQHETGIVIPEDLQFDVIKNATASEDVYQKAMQDLNAEIVIGIQGAVLQILEGSRTGARAATETHAESAVPFVDFLAEVVGDLITERIVKPLVSLNYNVQDYPTFAFEAPQRGLQERAEVLRIVVGDLGLPVARRHLYSEFGIPEPDDEDDLLEVPAAAGPGAPTAFAERTRRRADLADLMAAEEAAVTAAAKEFDVITARIRAAVAKKKAWVG